MRSVRVRDRRKVKSKEHSVHRNLHDICTCPLMSIDRSEVNEYLDRRRTLSSYPVKVERRIAPYIVTALLEVHYVVQ